MDKNLKKNIITGIAVVVSFLIAFFTTQHFLKKDIGAELVKVSKEMNKSYPAMIDTDTRLDSVSVVDSKAMQYNFTVMTIDKDSSEVDLKEAEAFLKKNSQNNLDTMAQMKFYRENKIPLKYHYNDKKGRYLLDFTIVHSKGK